MKIENLSHTNVQLFHQLVDAGYSQADLSFLCDVYKYSAQLFYGFQSSGKPFITHLIRTASILVMLKTEISVIAAGLIHSAYEFSDFGDGNRGISAWKRQQLKQKAGEVVEIYVMKYYALIWNDVTISAIYHKIKELEFIEQNVLLIRLANELEQFLDLEPLYQNNYQQKIQQIQHRKQMLIEMANILGYPLLVQQLAQAFEDILTESELTIFTNLQDSEFFSQISGRLSVICEILIKTEAFII